MRKNLVRLTVVGAVTLASSALVGAAIGAQADDTPKAAVTTSATPTQGPASEQPAPNAVVRRESGIVLEGTGEVDGLSFMVTVYENSMYGNSVQIVLGDPDDDRIGYAEQAEPFVVDGVLNATVTIQGKVVTLRGTVEPTGRTEKVVESQQDAGERIVTKGTHTKLATDVVLAYGGAEGAVDFAPAVAYDLETRSVTLYGR